MATFAGVIVRRLSNFTNVYNRMETTNKKIRGSAFVDDEGLIVFTPYATVDPEKRSLKLVFAGRRGRPKMHRWGPKTHQLGGKNSPPERRSCRALRAFLRSSNLAFSYVLPTDSCSEGELWSL